MKRKILITLDGSALSKKVLVAVRQLFAPSDTELFLLQVIDPLTYSPYIVPMTPTLTWDPRSISVPVLLIRPEEVATSSAAEKAHEAQPQKDRRSEVVYETPSI